MLRNSIMTAVCASLILLFNCQPSSSEEKSPESQPHKTQTAQAEAAPVAPVDTITIVTVNNRARLCPQPNFGQGQELLRIPTGTKLEVLGRSIVQNRLIRATWFKVSYNGKVGWVSQFDTDKAQ